jgi:hypothetical protein
MSLRSEICQLCYTSRHSAEYTNLQIRAGSGQRSAKRFENIRHVIGRLNHTMKAVKNVVAAGIFLPALFDNFEVRQVKSSPRSSPPLQQRNPTLMDIAGRLLSDPNDIAHYREALKEMDEKFNLSERLKDHCTSTEWRPRVHAELLVLDHFWTNDLDFVDGDRYIACSKPACYCCNLYIAAHPGLFKSPHSHNNCYLRWRAPDITDSSKTNLIKTREDILNDMTKDIRKEVLDQIRERRGPRGKKPDSLTEISSVRMEQRQLLEYEDESESSSNEESDDTDSEESGSCNANDDYRSAASVEGDSLQRDEIDNSDDSDSDDGDQYEDSDEDKEEKGGAAIQVVKTSGC